jgi:hypothetical protein
MVGARLGGNNDRSKPDTLLLENWKMQAVKPGSKIKIILKDGNLVNGKYIRLEKVAKDEYLERYARSRELNKQEVNLPELGDSINVTDTLGKQWIDALGRKWICELLGFDYHNIISIRKNSQTSTSIAGLDLIGNIIDSDGKAIEVDKIRNLMTECKIPLLSIIIV